MNNFIMSGLNLPSAQLSPDHPHSALNQSRPTGPIQIGPSSTNPRPHHFFLIWSIIFLGFGHLDVARFEIAWSLAPDQFYLPKNEITFLLSVFHVILICIHWVALEAAPSVHRGHRKQSRVRKATPMLSCQHSQQGMFMNQDVVTARIDVSFPYFPREEFNKRGEFGMFQEIADTDTTNIPEHVYGLLSLIQAAFAILTPDTFSWVEKPREHMTNLQKKVLHL